MFSERRVYLTPELLLKAVPGMTGYEHAKRWARPLQEAMDEYDISDSPERAAAFLAQIGHESAGLRVLEENLNYSARRLAQVWPKRFADEDGEPNALAEDIAGDPERIANIVYADRLGNGPPESGDGWMFRGRGPIQITGRGNYRRVQVAMPLWANLMREPELLATSEMCGALAAAFFWDSMKLNEAADEQDFDKISDLVNLGRHTQRVGDSVGYQDRLRRYEVAMSALSESFPGGKQDAYQDDPNA